MTRAAALLFDLDGTLTDPSAGIFASIRHAFTTIAEARGRPAEPPSDAELRNWIGPPLRRSFAATLAPEFVEPALAAYRRRYESTGLFECAVYEGIPAALDVFASADIPLYVATSKPERSAMRVLAHFGLDRRFRAICGATLDASRESKRDVLAYLLSSEGIPPDRSRVAMIGDRNFDVEAARELGVLAVGVLYGFGSRDELTRAGADVLVERPSELPRSIAAAFA